MRLTGQGVSSGVAVGPVLLWRPVMLAAPLRALAQEQVGAELERLHHALEITRIELQTLANTLRRDASAEVAAIFEAHIEMLDDPELIGEVREQIQSQLMNAEHALSAAMSRYATTLRDLGDDYLRQRASDLEDVAQRTLRHLQGDLARLEFNTPVIVLAEDLAPSDAAQFPTGMLLGFATASGGATSHTAILARALGIPAIVGLGHGVWQTPNGVTVTLDGDAGILDTAPSAKEIVHFRTLHTERQLQQANQRKEAQALAHSRDAVRIEVLANIASPATCTEAIQWGAEGVGLFRTEFLYLNRDGPPSESEQYAAYRAVIEALAGRRCLIRTADIGGDKEVPYVSVEHEANPFLGWRGTRLLWGMEGLLRTQLRALLRASVYGPLGIMFPMITGVHDLQAVKQLLASVRAELNMAGQSIGDVATGIMIELPSAALCAEHLAQHCDFFSIGTNDLTQYTLACDRTNPRVAHLLDSFHPAVLELIARTISAGQRAGIHVGMCGEMASDLEATPILLGLGLREFSVSPAAIPALKRRIGMFTTEQVRTIAKAVLTQPSAEAVRNTLAATLDRMSMADTMPGLAQ